ncbi:hypothetical protein AKJ56_01500 [candidate division MSBL1 archaeon SCGC-AAA382N08]|uniref:Uncharacterized protein n=1 Tax=candidate division MSBL1 archaeon SCGC-AAA382N08 TaxID=1698285 RepID=A0A133VPL1_9EURY|nr:hypothetical protein AKJ56_01500 [candidate division MSBL1 archaeon SCGC-AAA382N08]
MLILEADNRTILDESSFSYLSNNITSGVTSLTMASTLGLSSNDYLLLEHLGEEKAEIVQISSGAVDDDHNITLNSATATTFSHSETTRVNKILYNQVKFYRTTDDTFASTNVLGTITIAPQSYYTSYQDATNDTGFGWFRFYNSTTTTFSAPSNAIPYGDFAPNAAQKIIERFFSSLNNEEAKLISFDDAFSYLSEGYSVLYNELNLVNPEYTVSQPKSYTIVSEQEEYDLPNDFSQVSSITIGDSGRSMEYILISGKENYDGLTKYYLRGNKIGFAPIPSAGTTIKMYYNSVPTEITSYYDKINVPSNLFYCLQDFMLYRAAPKLQRGNGSVYYTMFQKGIQNMKLNSIKRSGNKDSWGIAPNAMV